MGQLVDQHQLRTTRQRRVEVELGQLAPAMRDRQRRQQLEPLDQRRGLAPPMRLDDAHQHVHALVGARAGGLQHRVGLADAGRGAEEDLQPAALLPLLLALDLVEKLVGIGTVHADWRAPVVGRRFIVVPNPGKRKGGAGVPRRK